MLCMNHVTWEIPDYVTDYRDLQKVPLYAHVADLAGTKKPFVLPVPFQNVVNGGMLFARNQSLSTTPYFYNEC